MAEWKTQISYNYNPSYHAYAYGFVYQPGHEQNPQNQTGWAETGVTDLSNYNAGVTTQACYSASTARTQDESPPESPEKHAVKDPCQYQGSGVVYLGETQAGRLFMSGQHQVADDPRETEARRAGSDSTSDTEARTSPDSWSSGSSSREGSLPQVHPATWVGKDVEASDRSPDASEDVSSSLMEEPPIFTILGNEGTGNAASQYIPTTAPKKPVTTAGNNSKAKVRAAFSESQMNALVQRFSVQRYLTPAEMKNLAEVTGLTYKQVKTWFQNRRMKLRRHQKDTSWVSERYSINKDGPVHGAIFTNMSSHIPPYQGEVRSQLREHYNQQMMEVAFKKTAPQNLAFYLAAMGSAAGSTGYPPWPPSSSQAPVPNRPQVTGWSMPPGVSHYEYNPSAFNSGCVTTANNASFESKDGEPVNNQSTFSSVIVPNTNP